MLQLMKSASLNKQLVKQKNEWDRKRMMEYMAQKKRFLEVLILGVLLTREQPACSSELGSIKFRNSIYSIRNLFVINKNIFYSIEYNKASASINYSYFIV